MFEENKAFDPMQVTVDRSPTILPDQHVVSDGIKKRC